MQESFVRLTRFQINFNTDTIELRVCFFLCFHSGIRIHIAIKHDAELFRNEELRRYRGCQLTNGSEGAAEQNFQEN